MLVRRILCRHRLYSTGPPGSADLDWSRLGFDFQKTAGYVKYTWENGRWDDGVFETEPYFKIHVMSAAIHYGQAVFEGAKAHHCKDGVTRLWNVTANAARMQQGCERMMMPRVPTEMFVRGCEWAVAGNLGYVPPYETKGSMYLRPYTFGHGPQLGLSPAPMFHFCVLAIPVASYYSGGLRPIDVLVVEKDRAAPAGVGHVKASGNYGADIQVSVNAKADGFATVLYLDAKEKKYIEEFSVSNFIGIKTRNDGRKVFVTPDANTVLASITLQLLTSIAREHFDMIVEQRPVPVEELAEFEEVAGCGTAVVIMGVNSVTHRDKVYKFKGIDTIAALYERYRAIQFGDHPDTFGWGTPCPPIEEIISS